MDRLPVSLKRGTAMTMNRISIGAEKLVYVICASKMIKYDAGKSPIVYIGTTKKGVERIAQSAAYRAYDILYTHGVDALSVRIVTCGPRQHVKTWHKLERALLLVFKEEYGEIPMCNTQGKNITETNEFVYFAKDRIRAILADLSKSDLADGHVVSS
ncbi:MAG: hypothetical protein ACR2F8_01040 [Caulobacteraceae bacterium]